MSLAIYIPRVHQKHSSRDIRIALLQQGIGKKVVVDLAYNPKTRFNMAFVTMEESVEGKLELLTDILNNKCSLGYQGKVKFYPHASSREFWLLLVSNCDHKTDEENLLKVPSTSQLFVGGEEATLCVDCFVSPVSKYLVDLNQ
jgi:hypothetical protein